MHCDKTVLERQNEELDRLIALSLRAADTAEAHASVSGLRGKLRRGRRGSSDLRNSSSEQHALSEYAARARDVAMALAHAVQIEKTATLRLCGPAAACTALDTLDMCCNALRRLRCVEEVRGNGGGGGVDSVLHGQQHGMYAAYPKLRARLLILFARAALASLSCDEQSSSCLGGAAAATIALREALCIGEELKIQYRHVHHSSDHSCEDVRTRWHANSANNHERMDKRAHAQAPFVEAALILRARALQQLSLPLLSHAHATNAAQLTSDRTNADKTDICAPMDVNGGARTASAEALRAVWRQRQRACACPSCCNVRVIHAASPGDTFAKIHDLMGRARVSASEGLANTAFLLLDQAKQLLICDVQSAEFPEGHRVRDLASRALKECNAAQAACCQRLGRARSVSK